MFGYVHMQSTAFPFFRVPFSEKIKIPLPVLFLGVPFSELGNFYRLPVFFVRIEHVIILARGSNSRGKSVWRCQRPKWKIDFFVEDRSRS